MMKEKKMKKKELIKHLHNIEGNPDIELLIQTKRNGDYYNVFTQNIITVEDNDNESLITIRGHDE